MSFIRLTYIHDLFTQVHKLSIAIGYQSCIWPTSVVHSSVVLRFMEFETFTKKSLHIL